MSLTEKLEKGFCYFGLAGCLGSYITAGIFHGAGYEEIAEYVWWIGSSVSLASILTSLVFYTIGGPHVPYEQQTFHDRW